MLVNEGACNGGMGGNGAEPTETCDIELLSDLLGYKNNDDSNI